MSLKSLALFLSCYRQLYGKMGNFSKSCSFDTVFLDEKSRNAAEVGCCVYRTSQAKMWSENSLLGKRNEQ